jgi:hypothetical protein
VVLTAETGTGWRIYEGTYTVPAGQTTTRIAFRALDDGWGGNLLDNVTVTLDD